jgi:hypothetical protein
MYTHAQLPFSSPTAAIGAFFFAMRSCEYVHVSGSRRTKPLCLRNLRFFRDNRVLLHSDPDLASATALAITFEYQKTDVRDEIVHQHSTGLPILCPVRRWAGIIQRILTYPGCDTDSPVSTVLVANDTRKLVTGAFLATQLRAAASRIGEDALGFSPVRRTPGQVSASLSRNNTEKSPSQLQHESIAETCNCLRSHCPT